MKFSKSFILFLLSVFSVLSCSKHVQDTDFQSGNTIRISMPESFGTKVSMGGADRQFHFAGLELR